MDSEFAHYGRALQDGFDSGDRDKVAFALQNLASVSNEYAGGNSAVQNSGRGRDRLGVAANSPPIVEKKMFDCIVETALKTTNRAVREDALAVLAHLLSPAEGNNSGSSNNLRHADERLAELCTSLSALGENTVSLRCLTLLIIVLNSGSESRHGSSDELVASTVRRGAISHLYRILGGTQNAKLRELCVQGLFALSQTEEHARTLHERDVWSVIRAMYESGYMTEVTLAVVRNVVLNLLIVHRREAAGKAALAVTKSQETLKLTGGDTEARTRASVHDAKGRMSFKQQNLTASTSQADGTNGNEGEEDEDSQADEGLLRHRDLDESSLDLMGSVCFAIDRRGIMSMLLATCQEPQREIFADVSLTIVGMLSESLHKVIPRENRVLIVRVLLVLVSSMIDTRLVSVCYVLDSFLKQEQNRGIVLQCGAATTCAKTGRKMILRKDPLSKMTCRAFCQLMLQISTVPGGATELSHPECIAFLIDCMKDISSTSLQAGPHSGKEEWSSKLEVIALCTLMNSALETPMISSVAEANVHKALSRAASRQDELGLLAILASAFFVGKAGERVRSREVPKVQAGMVDILADLLAKGAAEVPSLGGIIWTVQELLQCISYLVAAPHNLYHLKSMLPVMVKILRTSLENGDEATLALAVDILLAMSYSKHIIKAMTTDTEFIPLLETAIDRAPYESKRSLETLIISVENEQLIASQTKVPLVQRIASLSRSSLKRMSSVTKQGSSSAPTRLQEQHPSQI